MRLPGIDDFLAFTSWDGLLASAYLFVAGALLRTVVRIWRRHGQADDPTLRVKFLVGSLVMAAALGGGWASWELLPHAGPGIWGAAAVCGIPLLYKYALAELPPGAKGKRGGTVS